MSTISLRPATPKDADAVAALSAHIWEGDDYVPRRFAEWTADPHGQFMLAWEGDQLVGFGKLTRLRPDQWWLEGLRVHPQQRGRGIARLLHNHAVQLADEIGRGVLRFATAAENEAVHKLAADSGFQLAGNFCVAEASARSEPTVTSRLEPVKAAEVDAVRQWLSASEGFRTWSGFYEERWKWLELAPELHFLQEQNRLFWWRDSEPHTRGVVIVQAEHEEVLWVNYLDGPAERLPAMGADLRALASELGRQALRVKPPATAEFRRALEKAGWQIEEAFEMCVFERRLRR
ncbi:MAG: N-acetyltransferase family protein [Chloroflexota bacterium]